MPLYEEKLISPMAIRFSQARIRPTFQDGRLVERSLQQVEAVPWPLDSDEHDLLLQAPFPPIEIIRWWPKKRDQDGIPVCDDDGTTVMGEACWFTFDNRRLYCMQAAAVSHWPKRVAAVVHVMRDLPISRSTPRKFRTTDMGNSVRIARRYDPVPRAVWNWREATQSLGKTEEEERRALEAVAIDVAKEHLKYLADPPQTSSWTAATRVSAIHVLPVLGGEADEADEELSSGEQATAPAPAPEPARERQPQPKALAGNAAAGVRGQPANRAAATTGVTAPPPATSTVESKQALAEQERQQRYEAQVKKEQIAAKELKKRVEASRVQTRAAAAQAAAYGGWPHAYDPKASGWSGGAWSGAFDAKTGGWPPGFDGKAAGWPGAYHNKEAQRRAFAAYAAAMARNPYLAASAGMHGAAGMPHLNPHAWGAHDVNLHFAAAFAAASQQAAVVAAASAAAAQQTPWAPAAQQPSRAPPQARRNERCIRATASSAASSTTSPSLRSTSTGHPETPPPLVELEESLLPPGLSETQPPLAKLEESLPLQGAAVAGAAVIGADRAAVGGEVDADCNVD
eukprot:TRINITY_DN76084_c0_g1_i1.p1 TRINITY_DN76084_c0_g1~~TRINITY_DN76084_c0_g1_i1.p1  ORF type:complete len:569 (+),score=117.12 TRINITY_DN76084_c0_g1_i1:97-1803(+)